jgi:hypothetical protein
MWLDEWNEFARGLWKDRPCKQRKVIEVPMSSFDDIVALGSPKASLGQVKLPQRALLQHGKTNVSYLQRLSPRVG